MDTRFTVVVIRGASTHTEVDSEMLRSSQSVKNLFLEPSGQQWQVAAQMTKYRHPHWSPSGTSVI